MAIFKETSVNIGTIKAGQKDIKVEWLFDQLDKDDIALNDDGSFAIQPSCGCTANFEVHDDRITAVYNDGGNNIGDISKSATVYYKSPGQATKTKNNRGAEIYNPALGKTTLFFSAVVEK